VTELLALTRTNIEGSLVVVAGIVLFGGATWLLAAAVMGVRMGYLVTATALFGFMVILSSIWTFGAPGTPRFLGPKGDLPQWFGLAQGIDVTSPTFPVVERYPGEPWTDPSQQPALSPEVEAATLAFQEFLAEEATAELQRSGLEGEVTPETFEMEDMRFATVEETQLAMARAFAASGGPEVVVVGYKDPGNEGVPSFIFLGASLIGFVAHLPWLDRAEKKRKEILTGGEQPPWRGPA
jgi:hypothetical protein